MKGLIMKMDSKIKLILLVGLLVVVAACTSSLQNDDSSKDNVGDVDWRSFEFTDVNTGNKFSVNDFQDKPVLLESFAVWCPTCTKQQKEILKLHEELGDSFVSISLDTDPNEDEGKVKEHTERNGFTWRYAISPAEATVSLIDEFGINFVNAPSGPVVLICNGEAKFLRGGVKSAEELKQELNSC